MQWWEELAEAKDEGRLEGHEAGLLEGHEAGRLEGHEAGRLEGHEAGRLEGHEAGRLEGQKSGALHKLISMVVKKLQKGKAVDVIAEELEEDIDYIKRICEASSVFAPEYDVDAIMLKVKEL